MISEGSYDPEDWSSDCWKFSFAIPEIHFILINFILEYNNIQKKQFKM